MHDSIFQQINAKVGQGTALKTKGSGDPSGVDSNGFWQMMACKSFKKSGTNLCSAIATMMRRLCTEYVDPCSIEAIQAKCLIPLDKLRRRKGATCRGRRSNMFDNGEVCDECDQTGCD